MDFDSQSGHSICCASPRGRDNGDEQISSGFASPLSAINVATTPIRKLEYFVKVHKAGTLTLHLW
jgi:hypothetical protein